VSAGPGDLAAAVRATVVGHRAGDEREAAAAQAFVVAFDRLERPLDEDADPTHVTASAIVVGRRGVLLHKHRRLGRWLQPGGHLEPGEAPADAALRECLEETGLPATFPPGGPRLLRLDVHTAARGHVHLDLCFLATAPDADPDPPPGESQEVAWFPWEEAERLADDGLSGGLRSARRVMPTLAGPGKWEELS
jgi:8-oxo-dGTP pyrophosphatase MutT (NUDIX family)